MEDWDEEKLADVVGQKHGNEKKLETAIVRLQKFQSKFIYSSNRVTIFDRKIHTTGKWRFPARV